MVILDFSGVTNKHKSGHNVKLMGCISSNGPCSEECLTDDLRADHFFCCCKGNLCNSKFKSVPKQEPQVLLQVNQDKQQDEQSNNAPLLAVCIVIAAAIIIMLMGFGVSFKILHQIFYL